MGVDLKLLPLLGYDTWSAHDMLELERRRELWPEVAALPQQVVQFPVNCYMARGADGENRYGSVLSDPYGTVLRWTTAGDLMTLKDHEFVMDNWQNRAVWAYLAKMPHDWPVVLYWH